MNQEMRVRYLINSSLLNGKYYIVILLVSVVLNLVVTMYTMKKGENRLFKAIYVDRYLEKTLFNTIFALAATILRFKHYLIFWVLYFILFLMIQRLKNNFIDWFDDYSDNILSNIMQIFIIGAIYNLAQPSSAHNYINNDLLNLTSTALLFYAFYFMRKFKII
ncbi:hypothetical protein [Limosilactobacillus oris]|uniref:hypothetical protein n=1 Tax=Limosilactobacillus oris TaxID=1632 RepID=UPI002235C608|nr:hypothetical protein [Limosilactobacillus oris]MCW4388109.1 hypothetical protein [Limosilactobacillus oris]